MYKSAREDRGVHKEVLGSWAKTGSHQEAQLEIHGPRIGVFACMLALRGSAHVRVGKMRRRM